MVNVVEVIPHDSEVALLGGSDGASMIGGVDVEGCGCGGRWYFYSSSKNRSNVWSFCKDHLM